MSAVQQALSDWLADLAEYVPDVEAEKFVAHLRATDPGALAEWLDERAVAVVTSVMRAARSGQRAQTRSRSRQKAAEFADDPALWLTTYRVSDEDVQRRLGDMTAADHRFVAGEYQRSGNRDLMLATFHRQVAKRLGPHKTTAEVFTPESWAAQLASIEKAQAA